jgi:hypothetical protein
LQPIDRPPPFELWFEQRPNPLGFAALGEDARDIDRVLEGKARRLLEIEANRLVGIAAPGRSTGSSSTFSCASLATLAMASQFPVR